MRIQHLHFQSIPSTNSWAKEHAETLEKDALTLISAAQQTNGYGRFKHKWHSPSHQNLYISYVFFLHNRRDNLCNISQILALTAIEVLNSLKFPAKIKWPNDILINGKKLGGILCEIVQVGDLIAVVAGIGLNVNMDQEELKIIGRPATSLYIESGEFEDQEALLDNLTNAFKSHVMLFLAEGFTPFYNSFIHALLHKKGDVLQFHDQQSICKGTFVQINLDGSLTLQLENGTLRNYHSGEILL